MLFRSAVSISLNDASRLDEISTRLSGLDGVRDVRTENNRVTVLGEENLFPTIFSLAQAEGWPVNSVHVEQGRLDEVFRQLTEGVAA